MKLQEELLHRLNKGDDKAFCSLFHMYGKRIYRMVLDTTNDACLSKTVLKNTFKALYRRAKREEDAVFLLLQTIAKAELAKSKQTETGVFAAWHELTDELGIQEQRNSCDHRSLEQEQPVE